MHKIRKQREVNEKSGENVQKTYSNYGFNEYLRSSDGIASVST